MTELTVMDTSQEIAQSNPNPDEAIDNWTGITDLAERRRRQNRINQRAYRQRRRQADKAIPPKSKVTSQSSTIFERYPLGDPLSDHLMTLTRVNVFRAYGLNLESIGLNLDDMTDDAISPFNLASGPEVLLSHDNVETPLSLRPTKIQRTVPHHPWLDFFPLPKMRDNLIEAGDDWDDCELCNDIMGF
ncbi:hypothetical protein N7520_002889 [Penicillium odoratum]|uniref:uncharacterized protein n=1 Tax=Penicillium odoratum TaxID=1167516 RepID=UPI00254766A9|nr:uncharacterized protein N7520_002889 [Penicillium odoratum]KAJ5772360.1 hypothetical protein N7520_002889 [Penicillium odoratum]